MSKKIPSPAVAKVAPQEVHDLAPVLGWYSDHVLFHQIWNRPNLSRKDRSLVTVSALTTSGHYSQMNAHWNIALDHGLTADEIIELITHLAFQAGWPNAMSALCIARDVFVQRGIPLVSTTQLPASSIDFDFYQQDPIAAMKQPFRKDPFSAALAEGLEDLVERDVWTRPILTPRERSIATIATIVASGNSEQLMAEARRGLENGLTLAELCEIVLHLGYYVGLPKIKNSARILDPLGVIARM